MTGPYPIFDPYMARRLVLSPASVAFTARTMEFWRQRIVAQSRDMARFGHALERTSSVGMPRRVGAAS